MVLSLSNFQACEHCRNGKVMQAFRNSDPHLQAMKNIKSIGKAKSISWQAAREPDWSEAMVKLKNVKF
jgi:hypothetical protein